MAIVLSKGLASGDFVVSEARGGRSRESGLIDNVTNADILLSAGLIMNQVSAGSATCTTGVANAGNGAINSVSTGQASKLGVYVLTAKSSTVFGVIDPSGDVLPDAAVNTAYAGPIDFTIASGSAAFSAGDSFTVNVLQQTLSWVSWTGGPINRLGILFNRATLSAGSSDVVTILVRNCEVNYAELQWDPTVAGSGNVAALKASASVTLTAAGIILR